jgi:hypothetical protein
MQTLENHMGIIWYKSLYLGTLVRKKAGRIKRKIDRGIYPPGIYLVTLSGGSAVLELIPAIELCPRPASDGRGNCGRKGGGRVRGIPDCAGYMGGSGGCRRETVP